MAAGAGGLDGPSSRPVGGVRVVLHLGVRRLALIALHSARRRREMRREVAARRPAGPSGTPGRLVAVDGPTERDAVVRFCFDDATLHVGFPADDVVLVDWGPHPAAPSYAVVPDGSGPGVVPTVSADGAGGWTLATAAVVVQVSGAAVVRFARPDGTVLRSEGPPSRRGQTWCLPFSVRADERLGGLGEQAAPADRRGGRFRLWNRDPGGSWGPGQAALYMGIPVLVSTHADGAVLVFHDNPHRAVFDLGPPDGSPDRPTTATVELCGGALRHYVVAGPVPRLLEAYTALTGRPPLPPRWALGYHQSRWGYRDETDVRAVSDGFAEAGVPLSAVHLDIDHMRGYRVFTVWGRRFPRLPRLAADLGRRGTRLVAIVDPGVKVDRRFRLYRDGLRQRLFCTDSRGRPVVGVVWPGRSVFPDFTDPRARAWWADQYRTLVDAGVSGFWHDMNEPTSLAVGADPTLPLSTRHDLDGRGGDHAEAHNLYGLLMNRAGHEGVRRARPGLRPFILSRSGWAGTQRYAWNWTGDAETSWPSLRQQVATVVGLGLSGVPYSGSDIGGFSGDPDPELYLRWLQLGVLLPFCRTHSSRWVPPREPWRFPEPARTAIADWIRFRYRLLPYLYTLAHQATDVGAPLARPLWWPDGGRAVDADDAYLLGDDLLVAAVCAPGVSERTVPLPPGAWASLWGDGPDDLPAGRTVRLPAPPTRPPVLVRRGAVLPLDDGWADPAGACALDGEAVAGGGPGGRRSGGWAAGGRVGEPVAPDHGPRRLAFHCWPAPAAGDAGPGDAGAAGGGWAVGEAVDDAGDGGGPLRRDRVELTGVQPGGTALCRWQRTGDFPPPPRVRLVVHGWAAASATADGRPVAVDGGTVECAPFEELRLRGLRPLA